MIGRSYVSGLLLWPPKYELFAANKTSLPVEGDIDIYFTTDGHPMSADVSVSSAIDELLLGSDWLVQNACKWDFSSGTVRIGVLSIRTHRKGVVSLSQRIHISERCVILQDSASEQKAPLEDSLLSSAEPMSVVVESGSACDAERNV